MPQAVAKVATGGCCDVLDTSLTQSGYSREASLSRLRLSYLIERDSTDFGEAGGVAVAMKNNQEGVRV